MKKRLTMLLILIAIVCSSLINNNFNLLNSVHATSPMIEYQIDLFSGNKGTAYDSTTGTSYALGSRSCIVYVNSSKFVNPAFYFEAVLASSSSSGTAYAELYDKTSGSAVSGSPVSVSGTTVTRVRSSAITLTSTHEFEYYYYSSSSSYTCYLYGARIIVVDSTSTGWTKAESQIEIGDYETTTATSATALSYQPIYPYSTSVRDGTITIYFEATLKSSSSSGTAYAQLYDSTSSSVITTVSVAGTTLTRSRSSSISLTNGHNYVVRIYSSSSSYTAYIYDAKIIIQQIGNPLTKTELYKKIASTQTTTSASYVTCNNPVLLSKSNLVGVLTFYYQAILKTSSSSYTAYSELYDITGSSAVSGSPQSTTSTSWSSLKSSSLTLTDTHQFSGYIEESSTSGTCSIASAWLVIDLTATYNLNLRVQDWNKTNNIANAIVTMNNGSNQVKTSNSNGWTNYTGVTGSVTVTVKYFGYDVNYTSFTVYSNTTLNLQCKLYNVIVTCKETGHSALLYGDEVEVLNGTSSLITSGITSISGSVSLSDLPNSTLTFTQYGGGSYTIMVGNATQSVSSQNQAIALTATLNAISTTSNGLVIGRIH